MENKQTKNIRTRIKELISKLNNKCAFLFKIRKKPLCVIILFVIGGILYIFCYVIHPSPHDAYNSILGTTHKQAGNGSAILEKDDSKLVMGITDKTVAECDNNSNFIDNENEWERDNWWTKENNSNSFIYRKSDRGGPRMTYCNKEIYNNFEISFKFSPISNDGNKLEEINLIIYVGDLYSIIFDQNRDINDKIKNTYFYVLDNNGKNIYIEDDNKIKREKIHLDNKISFNKPSRIIIKQDCYTGNSIQYISFSVEYTPDKLKNAKIDFERATFEIEDSFCDNKNDFSIGLLNGRSEIIITKFDDFILKTYKN